MISVQLLGYILLGCWVQAIAVHASEHFNEDLLIRPLRDGKVASTFSFTTVLEGATPRNPQSLGGDDTCTWAGISEDGLKLTVISPTLHSVSASFGTSSARIRDNRITSLFERWKMGL